jgi:hypothetical protein
VGQNLGDASQGSFASLKIALEMYTFAVHALMEQSEARWKLYKKEKASNALTNATSKSSKVRVFINVL